MKISDLEDADQIVTKQYLDLRLDAVVHQLSNEFHKEVLIATRWAVTIMSALLIAFGGLVLGGVYFMLAHYKS